MGQRFHVARVELQRPVQLGERLLLLSHERVRHAKEMMRIGEGASGRDHLFQEVDSAVVVLELEPLARLIDEMLRTHVHEL